MVYLFVVNIVEVFEPAKFSNIASIFNLVVPNLIVLAGIIFFIMIVRAGLMLVVKPGNPEELKKIQQHLMYSVIGFVIIVISYILVQLIGKVVDFGPVL